MMSDFPDHFLGLTPEQRDLVEDRIHAFERAWEIGDRPAIADYLPAEPPVREPLVVELVKIELERRAKRGEAVGIEAYRQQFPEIAVLQLLDGSSLGGASYPTDLASSVGVRPGSVIGPYKLLQQIGEGGFGVVYMAEQERPVRRMVALKVIKPGMDTSEVIARFESERQALALMDHPNIAKVLDAGTTSSDRPFFVMELVKGVPITDYCDKSRLSPAERLKLFVDVCHAIQHAHHKGIIHRDIKPSNVMVTLHDGIAIVKVIDFGVAKATAQRLTEKTLFTAYGQMVGTPAYMSPEQAEMGGLDIDTRSDVYSLGVLLYELMTGTTPLEAERLRRAAYAEIQRLIREEEPPRPSTRLSSLGDTATVVASNRGIDIRRLQKTLSRDLDWVVMKALDKDRNRRYDTPASFADDIERYLRDEAVVARPPSAAYRLKKMAQRNRVAVVAGACVAIALLLGTAAATAFAFKANREAARAESKATKAFQLLQGLTESLKIFANPALANSAEFRAARSDAVQIGVEAYRSSMALEGKTADEEDASTWLHIGLLNTIDARHDEARKAYENAVRVALRDAQSADEVFAWDTVGQTYTHLGMELWQQGNRGSETTKSFSEARGAFDKALGDRSKGVVANKVICQHVAWFHGFCPDESFRNSALGLECAKRLAEQSTPSDEETNIRGGIRPKFTLAFCRYRLASQPGRKANPSPQETEAIKREFQSVKELLENVTRQSAKAKQVTDRDPYWWFLMSMIEAQLGDRKTARSLYEKAERCWKNERYGDFELHFLDAEATALLNR
jgi:serine/threonine protein kinase